MTKKEIIQRKIELKKQAVELYLDEIIRYKHLIYELDDQILALESELSRIP